MTVPGGLRRALITAGATLAVAAPSVADTVSGYVLDPVAEKRLAGVAVAFLISDTQGLSEMVRHTTDGEGRFTFSGPFLAAGTPFALVAHYQGLEYASGILEVGAQDRVILEVYEPGDSAEDVRIATHNLFLTATQSGADVAHLVQIDNRGEKTYVGKAVGDGRQVLEFALPEGNLGLEGHSGEVVRAGPTRVYDTRPLPPGLSQVSFTFQLGGEGYRGEYVHEVLYPTERLELFLQPASVELGAPFQDLGPISLHDQTYRHYRVEGLAPGRSLTVPLPFPRPLRWALKWALLALVPLALTGALALARPVVGPSGPGVEPAGKQRRAQLEEQRQTLLAELVRLDRRLEATSGAEAERLRRQRDGVRSQAVDVYRLLELRGD